MRTNARKQLLFYAHFYVPAARNYFLFVDIQWKRENENLKVQPRLATSDDVSLKDNNQGEFTERS